MPTVIVRWTALVLALTGCLADPSYAQRQLDHRDVFRVSFSPDGKTLASSGEGGIKFWTLQGKLIGTVKIASGNLAYSPDGKTLAAGHQGGVTLLEVGSLKEIMTIKDPVEEHTACHVAYSPDGATLAWRSKNSVTLWDVKDRKALDVVKAAEPESRDGSGARPRDYGISFSRNSNLLAWSNPKEIILWNVKERKQAKAIEVVSYGTPVFNPKEDILGFRESSGVTLWNTRTHEAIDHIKIQSTATEFAGRSFLPVFSPDGKRFAAFQGWFDQKSQGGGINVLIFDARSGLPTRKLVGLSTPSLRNPSCMAFSLDGSVLAIGSDDGLLELHFAGATP